MTINKRKKNSRQRGSTTHGWGAMKKHRGAGNRGGRGMAGTGKRADTKKPSIWADKLYFGKHGFKKKNKEILRIKAINIRTLAQAIDTWVTKGKAKKTKNDYEINLDDLGYHKLLSVGVAQKPFKITVRFASAKAIEKVKSAGGEVILPEVKGNKQAKPVGDEEE